MSLLDRMRLDQQTFAAFVGATYMPKHKQWRWRGRKNTARNKIIGILAHLLAAMLFPYASMPRMTRTGRGQNDCTRHARISH